MSDEQPKTRKALFADISVCEDGLHIEPLTEPYEAIEMLHSCGCWTFAGVGAKFCQWCGGEIVHDPE